MANSIINVKIIDMAGRTYSIAIRPNDTIAQLKAEIWKKSNIREEVQTLLFMGQTLEDIDRVYDHDIEEGCTITMVIRSVGGNEERPYLVRFQV